jgi:uncharacterized protein with FMN-binding domain
MDTNTDSSKTRLVTIGAIVVVAILAIGYAVLGKKVVAPVATDTSTSTAAATAVATTSAPTVTTITTTTTNPASTYKDGTYSATGSYQSPGGDEKIGVTVTLKDDVITSTSVTPEPVSSEGRQYQQRFASSYTSLVVGKKISDVHLTAVSGSSLTPIGFMNALTQIEAQAKA